MSDRVMIKDESTKSHNGIYVVTAAGDGSTPYVLTRSTDMDQSGEIQGAFALATAGGTNANTGWVVTSTGPYTVGTTDIVFSKFTTVGVTAGNGLQQVGTVLSVLTANAGRIAVSGSGIDLASGVISPGTYTKVTVDTYGRVTGSSTLSAGDIPNIAESQVTNLSTDLGLKAALASPAFTGTPTAPTAIPGTNNTQLATTAYVDSAVLAGVPDATTSIKGKVQLSGELGGVGTTAAAPTLKNIARVYNVTDYGALGDGSTDDASAIQNAVNAAHSAGGGTVHFPYSSSAYIIGTAITLYSFITIQGSGRGQSVVKMKNSANIDMFIASTAGGYDSITIEHLTVDGNAANQTGAGSHNSLIYITGSDTLLRNIRVQNNYVLNSYKHAIFLTGDNTALRYPKWVTGNFIYNHGPSVIGFGIDADYCPNTEIAWNTLKQSNGNDAIEMGHIGEFFCHNNYLVDGKIQFPFASNSIISNNILDSDVIQNDANTADNMVITGNVVKNATPATGYGGITVLGSNPTITGNYVKVTAQNGIRVYNSSTGGVISGNYVDGTSATTGGTNGIYPDHSNYMQITGNTITNFAKGVELTWDYDQVANNTITNCTTGVQLANTSGTAHVIAGAEILDNNFQGNGTDFDPQNQSNYNLRYTSSTGSTGFGTASPGASVDVSFNNSGEVLRVKQSGSGVGLAVYNASTKIFYVDTNAKVTADNKLVLEHTTGSGFFQLAVKANTSTNQYEFNSDSGVGSYKAIDFQGKGTSLWHIDTAGSIGVNQATPTAKLHINNATSSLTSFKVDNSGATVFSISGSTGAASVAPNTKLTVQQTTGSSFQQLYILGDTTNNLYAINTDSGVTGVLPIDFQMKGTSVLRIQTTGRIGINGVASPTASLHLPAGTASANTAPLKLTAGTNLTAPETGAIEFDGSHFYGTVGSTRYQLDQQTTGAVTKGFVVAMAIALG
jgi:hypothetical protein